jgi:uncharacterized membrane protein YeiH
MRLATPGSTPGSEPTPVTDQERSRPSPDAESSPAGATPSLTGQGYRRLVTAILQAWCHAMDTLAVTLPAQDDGGLGEIVATGRDSSNWTLYAAAGINALSGATFAARRGFDVIGVMGLAMAQGLGGMLLLAVLLQLGVPFVLTDPVYIFVAAGAGLLAFFFAAAISQALRLALVLDGLALGFLCAVGVNESLLVQLNPLSAVFIGVLTATGGLILRDIMAGIAPQVLRPGVWTGLVALIGSVLFVLLDTLGASREVAQLATVVAVGLLRTLAVVRGWRTHEASDLSGRAWRYWEAGR